MSGAVTSIKTLIEQFKRMGVEGRIVQIHASLKALGKVEGGAKGVLTALREAIGKGILLVPAFNFHAWSELGYFDIENTPSEMGWITEFARRQIDSWRTLHPMLSFSLLPDPRAFIGDFLNEDKPNAHGRGSIFDKLVDSNALLLSFSGKGFRPNDTGYTLVVHSMTLAGAPWRRMKFFKGVYVAGGLCEIREYAASVNGWPDKYVTEVTPAHEAAAEDGVIRKYPLAETECLVSDAMRFNHWAVRNCLIRPELFRREF